MKEQLNTKIKHNNATLLSMLFESLIILVAVIFNLLHVNPSDCGSSIIESFFLCHQHRQIMMAEDNPHVMAQAVLVLKDSSSHPSIATKTQLHTN